MDHYKEYLLGIYHICEIAALCLGFYFMIRNSGKSAANTELLLTELVKELKEHKIEDRDNFKELGTKVQKLEVSNAVTKVKISNLEE